MSTIWKWVKIIAGAVFAIGMAVVGFIFLRGKDGKPPVDPSRVTDAEGRISHDQEAIADQDGKIHDQEGVIDQTAEDARRRAEENENRPEQPGDAGKISDDLNRNW